MRNLYNLKGEGNNPQLSSAPQHETKKSRKNLLPLFALLLLMAVVPSALKAQTTVNLPYYENFESVEVGYGPSGWLCVEKTEVVTGCAYSGNKALRQYLENGLGVSAYTFLPDVASAYSSSDLTIDFFLKSTSTYNSSNAYVEVGYKPVGGGTSSFVSKKRVNYSKVFNNGAYQYVRVHLGVIPQGNTIALYLNSGSTSDLWCIDDVKLYVTPADVNITSSSDYTCGFEPTGSFTSIYVPEGFNYLSTANEPSVMLSSSEARTGSRCLKAWAVSEGILVLPHFSTYPGYLTLSFYAKAVGDGAVALQMGYVNDPDDASSFVSETGLINGSSTYAQYVNTYTANGVHSTSHLAIKFYFYNTSFNNGNWFIDDIRVYLTPTPTLPFAQNFEDNSLSVSVPSLPDGWAGTYGVDRVVADIHTGHGLKSLQVGDAVRMPRISGMDGKKLRFDFYAKPDGTQTTSSNISIGYVTSPNSLDNFTELKHFSYYSLWTDYEYKSLELSIWPDGSIPNGAYFVIRANGTGAWLIDDITVTVSPLVPIPYTESFATAGVVPAGWLMLWATPVSASGNTYLEIENAGYAILPRLDVTSYDGVGLDFKLKPLATTGNAVFKVCWVTDPNDLNVAHYHVLGEYNGSSSWTQYQNKSIDLSSVPAGARIVLMNTAYASWAVDDIHVYAGFTIPYDQDFGNEDELSEEGWGNYHGELNWNSTTNTGTANLTTDNEWHFDEQNGVFDSHAYTILGGNSLQFKWLVSPSIYIPSNASNANDIYLCATLALTRYTGNQVPVTAGQQDHEGLGIYITEDNGATWKKIRTFGNGTGYDMPFDNGYLPVNGLRRAFSLDEYRNKTVRIGFYAFNTDAYDAWNHIHIDDFYVGELDNTTAPSNVTVSEIGGHTAKVSWTPGNPLQLEWDIWIPQSGESDPNTEFWTIENLQQYGQLIHTTTFAYNYVLNNLTPNSYYRAWVRYRSGNTTSAWVTSESFQTVPMCAPPTNITVSNITSHSALVSWTPGQPNQTSWDTYGGEDDAEGEIVNVPYRLLTGLDPDEDYNLSITGYCEDGDGEAEGVSIDFHTLPLPTLTLNDSYSQDNNIVPITCQSLEDKESRTQFILPAEMLTPMQYSEIKSITFYDNHWRNATPWGSDIWFLVKIMEVPESNYNDAQYPEDQFYGYWDDENFQQFNHGTLHIDSEGKVTINASYPYFHYGSGNLLIGVWQDHSNYDPAGTNYQADWAGEDTQDWSSMYVPAGSDPMTAKFLPKVTFTYETDAYLPPTDLEAQFVSPNEVFYSWTPRAGQTGTIIQIATDADFSDVIAATNSTDSQCVANFGNTTLQPETDYYVRAMGVYGEEESAWGPTFVFITPDACEPPASLAATPSAFSATLNWVSGAAYDEVEYREVLGETSQVTLQSNFNNVTQLAGWTLYSNETANWEYYSEGTVRCMKSTITASTELGVHRHYLITPQIQLPGSVTFDALGERGEKLYVYVSTTGTNASDFTQVKEIAVPYRTFAACTADLTGYEGAGYIAIVHSKLTEVNISPTPPSYTVSIDNFKYNQITTTYSDWTPAGLTSESTMTLTGLTPGHTYEARVKAHCNTGFASDWSTVSFTTESNIVFEDEDVEAICVANWGSNGHLTYAQAAAVTTLNPSGEVNNSVFKGNADITKFNELQYFTRLTSIEDHAFAGCSALQEITLPPQITSIGNYAFGTYTDSNGYSTPCSSLHSIVIPEGVTTIGAYAFSCSGLQFFNLPSSVTTIGQLAYENCPNLTSIYLPATVTNIDGANSFAGCNLYSIVVDPENPVYDSRDYCNAIIKTSTNQLVAGCKNTVIPNGVVSIGRGAFEYATGLTSITLPSSVATIGESAFSNCTGLTSIIVESYTPPTIENNAFQNVNTANITVYVPCGRVAAYQAAEGWSSFANIVGDGCETSYLLVAGEWKWWAPFEGTTAAELMGAFDNGIVQGDILINSQDEGFLRRSGGTWGGTLTSIEPGKMYKILTEASGMLTVTGEHPSTVTVELGQGYTWFGFIGNAPVEIQVALGTTPTDGDIIFTKDGHTYTYSEDNGLWQSNDGYYIENFNLQPGYGYIYYSASGSKTLIMQQ